MRDHRKLRAYFLADRLAMEVYAATQEFPRSELFGLAGQMRRAAVSVACNIVEGSARFSEAEYVRFLEVAHGSSREIEYQLSLARRLGYVTPSQWKTVDALCVETSRVLAGLVRALRGPHSPPRPSDDRDAAA